MERKYSVYRHTCPNGKVYIGITCLNPEERWKNGHGYKNNQHFFNAIKKFGWDNIKHEILGSNLTKKDACDYERLFIFLSNSTDKRFGYNHESGGEIGSVHNIETKRHLSEIGKTKTGELNSFYGHKHSEESKKKMSIAKQNNPNTSINAHIGGNATREMTKKTVIQCDLEGNPIREFESTVDACLFISKGKSKFGHIAEVCNGKRKTWLGYKWKYKGVV